MDKPDGRTGKHLSKDEQTAAIHDNSPNQQVSICAKEDTKEDTWCEEVLYTHKLMSCN